MHQALDAVDKKKLVNINASHTCQRDKFLTHAHIKEADPKRFQEMKKGLENNFIKGNPNHKTTVQDSHAFVSNCKLSRSNFQKQHEKGKDHEGLAFAQQGNGKNNNDDNDDNNNNSDEVLKCIMCCVCGKKGHVATRCPQRNTIKDETCNANAEQEEEEQEPPKDAKPKASSSSTTSSKSKKKGEKAGQFVTQQCESESDSDDDDDHDGLEHFMFLQHKKTVEAQECAEANQASVADSQDKIK